MNHRLRVQVVLMDQEFIGALRFDVPGRQSACLKVLEVERDDGLRASDRCGGEKVAVFGMVGHDRNEQVIPLQCRVPGLEVVPFQAQKSC